MKIQELIIWLNEVEKIIIAIQNENPPMENRADEINSSPIKIIHKLHQKLSEFLTANKLDEQKMLLEISMILIKLGYACKISNIETNPSPDLICQKFLDNQESSEFINSVKEQQQQHPSRYSTALVDDNFLDERQVIEEILISTRDLTIDDLAEMNDSVSSIIPKLFAFIDSLRASGTDDIVLSLIKLIPKNESLLSHDMISKVNFFIKPLLSKRQ